ncbi:MAG: cohesin domain-containing protein [bacterium]
MKHAFVGFLLLTWFPVEAFSALDLVEYWNFRNARWDYEGQLNGIDTTGRLIGTVHPGGERRAVSLSYTGTVQNWTLVFDYDSDKISLLGFSFPGDEFLWLDPPVAVPRFMDADAEWTWPTNALIGDRTIPIELTLRARQSEPLQTPSGVHEDTVGCSLAVDAGLFGQIETSFILAHSIGPVKIERMYSGQGTTVSTQETLSAYFPELPSEFFKTPTPVPETPTAIPETPTSVPTSPTPRPEGTLIVGDVSSHAGDQVTLGISASGMPELDSFQFDLLYDPDLLRPDGVTHERGTLTENWYAVKGAVVSPGRARIVAVAGNAAPISGDGLLLEFHFTVKGDAVPGITALSIENVTGQLEILTPVDGTITILPAPGTPTATPTQLRPTPTPTPIRRYTFIPVTPIASIATFTPTPTSPPAGPNVPEFRLNVLERVQRSSGKPVRFTCELIPKNRVRSRVYLKVLKLDSRMLARFDPPNLTMPGVSVLKISLTPGIANTLSLADIKRVRRDIEILAAAVPRDKANANIASATWRGTVIFTPGEEPTLEQRTILNRVIPIYLTTDSPLTERVGDVVQIGGRLGMNPGIGSVQLYAQRGEGLGFYANVPLRPGDDRFLVRIPVLTPPMLARVWRVGAQFRMLDEDFPIIGRSGILKIPVGALREEGKWMRGKRLLAQEDILSALFGNLVLVAGAPDSRVPEETIQRLIRDRYEEMTAERRFTSDRLAVYSETEIPGEPEVPVTSPVSTQALVQRIEAVPAEDPLTVYCVGSVGGVGQFQISGIETLDVNALGTALSASRRIGTTLLIIDCDHAAAVGSAIRTAAGGNPSLLIIASTGAGESNFALFGTLPNTGQPFSFSDFFFDQLLSGLSLQDSFEEASDRLIQIQGPVRFQEPVLLPAPMPETFNEFTIGAPYVASLEENGVPDNVEPVVLTGTKTSETVRGEPLTITATVEDESTAPEDLRVIAHVALSDDPSVFVEFAMEYDTVTAMHQVILTDFPEGVFGPDILAEEFTVSILAEDDSGNSADPLVTSIVVTDSLAPWNLRLTDMNGDGMADSDDLLGIRSFWHEETEDDISGDGAWGPLDLLLMQMAWQVDWE